MSIVEKRKAEHIDIVLKKSINYRKTNGFERIEFVHNALPEINFDEINLKTEFLNKKFDAPLLISAMTGGTEEAEKINKDLAKACEKFNIPFELGSQRAMIENEKLSKTYDVKKFTPGVFLVGNIGAMQLDGVGKILEGLKKVRADAVAIHINPLQEILQKEGDTNWKGVLERIKEFRKACKIPIIVKEVGAGISGKVARKLEEAGVDVIDVAGAGGTSWAGIEILRNNEKNKLFWNWGIPTFDALEEAVSSVKIPVVASGGIRNGIEIAKAIRMGAAMVGIAAPFLRAQNKGGEREVEKLLMQFIEELKITMFLTGSKNLEELRKAEIKRL